MHCFHRKIQISTICMGKNKVFKYLCPVGIHTSHCSAPRQRAVTNALLMTSENTHEYPQVCRHGNRVVDYWFVSAVGSGIEKSIL